MVSESCDEHYCCHCQGYGDVQLQASAHVCHWKPQKVGRSEEIVWCERLPSILVKIRPGSGADRGVGGGGGVRGHGG